MSTLTVSNLQSSGGGGVAATLSSLNGGPLSGARNRIINGGMDIWQRGTSTTTAGNTYLADRWQSAFSTGGTVSQETSSLPTGSRYTWKFVASASNTYLQMGQQIEYINCIDLQNTTVAISFMARAVTTNAGSTALTVRTRTIAGVDGTCMFTGSNSDTAITLTTTWTRYTVTRTLPASFGSLSLEFVLGSHVSGDGIMLSQVQLEAGSVATPFERRSYGQELALCQRYYQKSYSQNVAPGTNTTDGRYYFILGVDTGTRSKGGAIRLSPTMRSSPSVVICNDAGTSNTLDIGGTPTLLLVNDAMIQLYSSTAATEIAGHWTASSEL